MTDDTTSNIAGTAAGQTPAAPLPLPPTRRRWVKIAILIGVFLGGLVVGSAVTTLVIVHKIRYAIHHPDEFPNRLAAGLRRKLSLTSEQEAQVSRIFTEHQASLQRIRREVQPKVEVELRSVKKDVDQVLTETQREKWDSLFGGLLRDWVPAVPEEK